MKRLAYLLANTDGLPGIKKDIEDFRCFLESPSGGAWKSTEIVPKYNVSLSDLGKDLALIKLANYDYVIFYYSGHGGWKRETRLYINAREEFILESDVSGLAKKQLSIFDCCRVTEPEGNEKIAVCDEALNTGIAMLNCCRRKFDQLIEAATPQEVRLYACQPGQFAIATGQGSLYSQSFLKRAELLSRKQDVDPNSIHYACKMSVSIAAGLHKEKQDPDIAVLKYSPDYKPLTFAIAKPRLMFG